MSATCWNARWSQELIIASDRMDVARQQLSEQELLRCGEFLPGKRAGH